MAIETLTVERSWITSNNQTTILRDSEGRVKQIITNPLQQPKKSRKKGKITEITIRGKLYNLKFI